MSEPKLPYSGCLGPLCFLVVLCLISSPCVFSRCLASRLLASCLVALPVVSLPRVSPGILSRRLGTHLCLLALPLVSLPCVSSCRLVS